MTENEIRGAILAGIAGRAPHYTPEWRFNPSNPDAGTAMAMLWADMHAGTLERFGRLPDNYKRTLLDALGSKTRLPVAASGYLAFTIRGDAGDFIIPSGTVVSSPSNPDAALVTCRELAASPAEIVEIYCVIPSNDAIERYDSLSDTELFRASGGQEHIWTFTHDFALNVSQSAALRLTPRTDNGGLEILASSLWEYLDGEDWRVMPVTKEGVSLLCDFPAKESFCGAVRVSMTRDTVLYDLTAKPTGAGLFPDALYTDGAQEADGFYPFGQRYIPGVCAYFACNDALAKPGAQVELSFNINYDNFEIEGYPETQIRMKRLMRDSDFEPPKKYEISASEVKWEYFNGMGWAVLGIVNAAQVFNGKTSGRIKLAFNCPKDICSALVGAHDLMFIRVRLIAADNLFRQRGYYIVPRISDIRFGYRYSGAVTGVSVEENLDNREVKLPARLAAPPNGPAALYFAFDREITSGTVLFQMKAGTREIASRWEYLSDSGWMRLDVHDDTCGLSETGILSYQTQTEFPSAKMRIWGRKAYWFRLASDGNSFDSCLQKPFLLGLYENAVPANAVTPGKSSVLPPDSFTTIMTPLAGVESAANPLCTYGGTEAEEESDTIDRLCAVLSHTSRSVSAGDCEALALESSLRVHRARLYAHTDEHGNNSYGESCLVILPRDAEMFGFDEICDEVRSYLSPRRVLGAGKLHIVPPKYIAVNVYVRAIIDNHTEALTVKNRIEYTLESLFSPVNWDIGQLPAPGRINTVIRAVAGIQRLIKVDVSYVHSSGLSADYARVIHEAFVLPVNGKHTILFTSN